MWLPPTQGFLVELDRQLDQEKKKKKEKGKRNSLTPWLLPKMLLYKEEKFCSTYSVIIKFLS